MPSFIIKTENNKLKVEYFLGFIEKGKVNVEKSLFSEMCKTGCKNYGKKYSCPPASPSFNDLVGFYEGLFVVLFKCSLREINSTEYNKVRIANAAIKSRVIKLMNYLEDQTKTMFLSTGSCNLCKPCKLKLKAVCAHPEKRRYSLESTGIDCGVLSKELFKTQLLWYKNNEAPRYTCVICGLICNKRDVDKIERKAVEWINNFRTNRKLPLKELLLL